MKHTKILALVLCLCMVVSMFAACGGNNGGKNPAGNAGTASDQNDQYIDDETGEIINIGSSESMKTKPEEIGTLANPVVRACEAYPSEQNIKWKEEAYGLIYDYEKADDELAKWVAAFVAGDAYDVIWLKSGQFPTVAQNGFYSLLRKSCLFMTKTTSIKLLQILSHGKTVFTL